jgi:hypothetical protein
MRVETGDSSSMNWWITGDIEERKPLTFLLKGNLNPERHLIAWDGSRKQNTLIIEETNSQITGDLRGYHVLEHLDFHFAARPHQGKPTLRRFTESGAGIITSPGELAVRYYWEWGDTPAGWFHAEFTHENFKGTAGLQRTLSVSTDLTVSPVLDTTHKRLEVWLDGTDGADHQLFSLSAPPDRRQVGQLEILNSKGEKTHLLELEKLAHGWDADKISDGSFSSAASYHFFCDLGPLGNHKVEASMPPQGGTITEVIKGRYSKLNYPKASTPESAARMKIKAQGVAAGLDRFIGETYKWYGLSPPSGIDCWAHLYPPTAGGSSGRYIVFYSELLQEWDNRRPLHAVVVHEFGHSLHCIEPLRPFFDASDADTEGLFNESQASFMGSIGNLAVADEAKRLLEFLYQGLGTYHFLTGSQENAADVRARLCYLTICLQKSLGDEFVRKFLRLGLMDPPTLRNRIRSKNWTPIEKICALFSLACDQDLTPTFLSMKFDIRPQIIQTALMEFKE